MHAVIRKKIYGSGCPLDLTSRAATPIISNVEVERRYNENS